MSGPRMSRGTVSNGDEVINASDGQVEKLNHLSVPQGRERLEVPRLHAGDIGVVAKLKHTHTNDTLCAKDRRIALEKISFPDADLAIAIKGATRADENDGSPEKENHHADTPAQNQGKPLLPVILGGKYLIEQAYAKRIMCCQAA